VPPLDGGAGASLRGRPWSMGMELVTPLPLNTAPIDPADLAAEVLKLAALAERLDATLGREETDAAPASGLCACVGQLKATVGKAPNAATGEPGTGLCSVVAELATAYQAQTRRVVTGTTLAAGGVVVVIESVLRILQAFTG
jgi:hypothetical protein